MPIIVGDVVRVIFSCWQDGQLGLNIRHFVCTSTAGGGADPQPAADDFFDLFDDAYADLLVTTAFFLGCSVRVLSPPPLPAAALSSQAAIAGLVAGDALPAQVSGIITLQTALAGRANRGRVYVPFPSESDSGADHRPGANYMTSLGALVTLLTATHTVGSGANTSILAPVIRHANGTFEPITGATARQAWATQRRRGAYGQMNPKAIAV